MARPRIIDYAAGRPGAAAIKAAGFQGAIRYMVNSPDRGLPNKSLTPEEARDFHNHGLTLASVWQRGKGPTADWRRGRAGGVEDARAAEAQHKLCGGPDHAPIFFAIDDDVNITQWNSTVAHYLRGCAEVIGKQRVGCYGGIRSMWWAEEDDLIGKSTSTGFLWLWQTRSWSSNVPGHTGIRWHEKAVLRQERIDQDRVGNIGIDINTTWADDYGQWQVDRSTTTAPKPSAPSNPAEAVLEQLMGPLT